jgi:hypothetical protein
MESFMEAGSSFAGCDRFPVLLFFETHAPTSEVVRGPNRGDDRGLRLSVAELLVTAR